MVLAAVSGTLGVILERWLFFAEAKHTVTLYYGASAAWAAGNLVSGGPAKWLILARFELECR